MLIELDKLEAAETDAFAHIYEPGELVLDDEDVKLPGPTEIRGRIRRSGNQVRLKGRVKALAEVACVRCLKPIDTPVEAEFDARYITAEDYAANGEAELEEEDLSLSTFDGAAIDVDELAREQLLLALPSRTLCREDCKGLCPVCGADKNAVDCECEPAETDPRWAALKKW